MANLLFVTLLCINIKCCYKYIIILMTDLSLSDEMELLHNAAVAYVTASSMGVVGFLGSQPFGSLSPDSFPPRAGVEEMY